MTVHYTLTDTIGTSGTLTVDADTDHDILFRWYGQSSPEIFEQMEILIDSLGVTRPMWDEPAAMFLGITVEVA